MSSRFEPGPGADDVAGSPTDDSDEHIVDPDVPHEWPHASAFAFGDSTPIGETDRLARERAAYEAAGHADYNRGHAVGGSDGSTEGQ
ncbi:hypothetical protein M0655_08815 [Gordonia amicalis]|uniref:Uncharacterized protein n=1 Tax=Gordonia amicalis TaxID=89053 RepID=A0AAE4R3K8_9ACTN|nr:MULTISPECIES: hypothetical protein [Gordonia]MBA5846128.1 hypothetical protein [Gordonia amicalis]MCZ0914341.1 hypothetical protein [Gordonia amicalis]MDV6310079.1 hypothetical protein [Gordonia amicalis]MDV6311172.1 hypothetical protein [Gordonia amicalis]MDV7102521.1 hypothetical protein [Gordonia amicalis]